MNRPLLDQSYYQRRQRKNDEMLDLWAHFVKCIGIVASTAFVALVLAAVVVGFVDWARVLG